MSKYTSKRPNDQGIILYTEDENQTWSTLVNRQMKIIENRASNEFMSGLEQLNLPHDRVPQLKEINQALSQTTGWKVQAVPAMISPETFFKLLCEKTFPAATFIRVPEELDYLQEPDIFHEIFGHCPMICCKPFAEFMQAYGQMALKAPKEFRSLYARLFWFTVEFGLIRQDDQLKCYGGGILSSIEETVFALESKIPKRLPFEILEVLRTPYRYDEMQAKYFVIESYEALFNLINADLEEYMSQAIELGDHALVSIHDSTAQTEWKTC